MTNKNFTYLSEQLALHHINVSAKQEQQLQQYIEMLRQWNRVYNLVGNADTKHIVDRHIIDSLLVLPYVHGKNIVDVGTGAGLPGIPLAIMLPDAKFVLLDSNGKKTRFITQVKIDLQLTNVEVVKDRVEAYQPAVLFDIVISRAFASLDKMLSLTQHVCVPKGEFLALKGEEAENEVATMPANFHCKDIKRLAFADKNINRRIIVVALD